MSEENGMDGAAKPERGTLGASPAMVEAEARLRTETMRADEARSRAAAVRSAQANLDSGYGLRLFGKALKVAVVVDPAVLAGLEVPHRPQTPFTVEVGGRVLKGSLNSKTLRRTIATIAERGVDGVAVLVQGRLVGERLDEAGIAAQPKNPKAAVGPEG
jgi:hypothetical protein